MNELPVEVLFVSFHIFMILGIIYKFLRVGVRQRHYSAKEVVFQKLMFCKRSVCKIRSSFFHLWQLVFSALKKLAVGCISIAKTIRTGKTSYVILRW